MVETCIWCGHELLDDTTHKAVYACGSVQHPRSDVWSQSAGCMEILDLRKRFSTARQVLEGATRFDVIPWDGGVSRDPSDGGGEVDADIVDQAIEILKGETDATD